MNKILVLFNIVSCSFHGVTYCCGYKGFMQNNLPSNFIETHVNKNNAILNNNELSFSNNLIICTDSEKTIVDNFAEYHFRSNLVITSVSCEGSIELTNYSFNGNDIICTLSGFSSESEAKLFFYSDNTLVDFNMLYFAMDTFGVFYSSQLSLDVAKRNAGNNLSYRLEQDTDEYPINNYYSVSQTRGIGVTGSVSGVFKWTDDEENEHPLIGAKVKLTIGGSWWSSVTYTNQNGEYNFSYNDIWYIGSGKPKVTLYADNGESIEVKNGGIYSKAHEFSGSSGNFTYSYTFSPMTDGDIGKAMVIFQAAKFYSDYAKELNNNSAITKCSFIYPSNPSDGCYYSNNVVTITSKPRVNESLPNSYASWDVIGHEYGHHVQKCFSITANPGGTHYVFSNNIDDQYDTFEDDGVTRKYTISQAKDRGLKLSWGEGWPTYWSTIAQQSFPDEFKDIPTVGDTSYTSYNGVNYDLDTYSYNSYGDADEVAIQRVLFKLNSSTIDDYDKFSISDNTLWNIVVDSRPVTFYEFINAMYERGYNRYNLGTLLAKYNIAVANLSISNNYLDRCPTYTWSTYMGSDYLRYNSFDLVFLNTRGQEVLRKNNITSTSTICQYTLTKYEWGNLISVYGKIYYAYIVARQVDTPTSGNYYSELFQFVEPDDFIDKVQIKPNEWGFEPQYFFTTNKWKQTSTPVVDHGMTIVHDRLRCGFIENSYVILSPRRENAGLAYLTMSFSEPVYSYMFGVTLWSNSEGLSPVDCTAVVETMDSNGNWSEDLDLLNDITLSIRTQQIDRYETAHYEGIYGLRFVVTSPAVGTRNKGRICLDDIVLNTDPNDLWFISTFYE